MTDSGAMIDAGGHQLHYVRLGGSEGTPVIFLHEGLGSVELWRGFPADVAAGARQPGIVYSRHGNGWSEPLTEPRRPEYMHREGLETLPDVVDAHVDRPPILVGHSDGASIALIYAGAGHPVAGLVLIAPHVVVEEEGLDSIRAIRDSFATSDLGERMAKYHSDPEGTFFGWADIWLDPEFRSWNIEEYLSEVRGPTLVIQGTDDEYGTIRQVEIIEEGIEGPVDRLIVDDAGHSPHLTHPAMVTGTVIDFIAGLD
jgi:pimeloyl-ACP methyl ester carboxylesterase